MGLTGLGVFAIFTTGQFALVSLVQSASGVVLERLLVVFVLWQIVALALAIWLIYVFFRKIPLMVVSIESAL